MMNYNFIQQKIIKNSISKVIERLREHDPDAYLLLLAVSVYRQPVPEHDWLGHLAARGFDRERQQKALNSLRSRHLVKETIDKNDRTLLFLEPTIRDLASAQRQNLKEIFPPTD